MDTKPRESPGAVVVTGASTGIGEACARELANRGFRVFAGIRRAEDGERLAAQAALISPLRLDVTDQDSIAAAAQEVDAATAEAGLAGLVNNAGVAMSGPLEYVPIDELRRQLEVNVVGQIAVTQAMLPAIRRGTGRIVNIGSVGGRMAAPLLGPYAASKFAMEGVTDSLRRELRPWGIHVAIVEPGAVATPIWDKSGAAADEVLGRMPPEVEQRYGKVIAAVRGEARRASERGIAPSEVAAVVAHALTAKRPRTRYPVGRDAKIQLRAAQLLPDRAFDALVARQLNHR